MLFETIVALLLLGLCLLPLAALVDGLSASVRRMEEGLSSDDRSQEDMQRRWDWGPRVVGAEWRPNGALEVQAVGGAGQVSAAVGLWMDGWFRLEVAVDSGGRAVFTAGDFAHVAEGAEVIIRVREERGAWGPPWRNSVGTETEGAGVGSTITEEVSTLVVHSPMAGSWEMSLQAGGGTSSEVDGADRFLRLLPTNGCLHTKCLHESIYVGLVCTHVKVAVGATRLAERYMEIDAGHYSVSCL